MKGEIRMDEIRNYQRCNVMGEGELFVDKPGNSYRHGIRFHIIDVSASGIRIRTKINVDADLVLDMKIRFGGHITDIPLNVKAKVTKKEKKGTEFEYALRYLNLSNENKIEIDEIVRMSCNYGII